MHLKRADPFQLVCASDLTVYHSVPVVFAGMFLQRKIHGIQHLVQASISDSMDSDLHTVAIGIADHFIQVFRSKQRKSAGIRLICIWP